MIQERTGLGPRYGYEVLLDLARPWVIAVPAISARGEIGDRLSRGGDPGGVVWGLPRGGRLARSAAA